MAIPSSIVAQFRDTATVRLAGAADAYGAITLGDPFTVRCRVSSARLLQSTTTGDQVITSTVVHMEDIEGFTTDATLAINGTTYSVKSMNRPAWPDGSRHLRVIV